MIKINQTKADAAILGGAILGGGGGGWMDEGKEFARLALENNFHQIVDIDEIPPDTLLLTVSLVGSPARGRESVKPEDYVRTVELFIEKTGLKIGGLITSEIGGFSIVNGWLQSALLKLPVIDAPCNGRAHPLGMMGSMGLHQKKDYISIQTVVGINKMNGVKIERIFKGSVDKVSKQVLETAGEIGGMVAVARNPIEAYYVKDNGSPKAISMAIKLGEIVLENKCTDSENIIKKITGFFNEEFIIKGIVKKKDLKIMDGLDTGKITILSGEKLYELIFWNEYMTLDCQGKRLAQFPDLIMTFDVKTANPLISAEILENQELFIIGIPAHKLILGSGVKDRTMKSRLEYMITEIKRDKS